MDIWWIDFKWLTKIVEDYINLDFKVDNIELNFKEKIKKKDLKKIVEYLDEARLYNWISNDSFNKRLDIRWWELFNKIDYLIEFSLFSVYEWQKMIDKNNAKNYVLIQLHARQILLAKEILVLLKNGFGEWANARWRSLYENVVITLFISEHNDEIAIRFLKHKNISNYKEAKKYKESYKRLRHLWYGKENLIKLEKQMKILLKEYWKSFYWDYWWIPDEISTNKNFSTIEKNIKMEHFSPYFKMSSRSIHSSSKSFDNLWLNAEEVVLIWPSNIWLTDPIQNTAMFILKWAVFVLLSFVKELSDSSIKEKICLLYFVKVLQGLENGIGKKAIDIQRKIDNDEQESTL